MSEELKPCPFCGGEEKAFFCEESGRSAVYCSECDARLKSGVPTRNYRYCPKCGSRIKGNDDE